MQVNKFKCLYRLNACTKTRNWNFRKKQSYQNRTVEIILGLTISGNKHELNMRNINPYKQATSILEIRAAKRQSKVFFESVLQDYVTQSPKAKKEAKDKEPLHLLYSHQTFKRRLKLHENRDVH